MKGLLRLICAHSAAVLWLALAISSQPASADYDGPANAVDKDSPEISAQSENTTRRRKRTRWRTLLAPHERPERPRLA